MKRSRGRSRDVGSLVFCLCVCFYLIDLGRRAAGYFCLGNAGEYVKVVSTSVF